MSECLQACSPSIFPNGSYSVLMHYIYTHNSGNSKNMAIMMINIKSYTGVAAKALSEAWFATKTDAVTVTFNKYRPKKYVSCIFDLV